jgi:hypothetical protein
MPTFQSHSSGTLLEEPARRKVSSILFCLFHGIGTALFCLTETSLITDCGVQRAYHDFLHSESRPVSPSSSPPPRLRFSITPSPSNHLSNMSRPSPAPLRRFPGDGFDHRRPIMSTSRPQQAARTPPPVHDVIDLTNDSDNARMEPMRLGVSVERDPARFESSTRRYNGSLGQRRQNQRPASAIQVPSAAVIDLETLDFETLMPPPHPDEPLMVSNEDFLALFTEPPSSPGFEITGERSLHVDPPRRSVAERRPTPYVMEEEEEEEEGRDFSEPPQLPPPLFQHLPHGLAGWLDVGARILGGGISGRSERNVPSNGPGADRYILTGGAHTPAPQFNVGSGWQPRSYLQLPRLPALDAFQRPRLNYEAQGFELIGAAPQSSPPPRPSSPYKAPRASAGGYTRKVEEDEIVVCPHCGDELGTGDDELKQQIWVVKQCGHVSSLRSILQGIILTTYRSTAGNVLRIATLARARRWHRKLRANRSLSRRVLWQTARSLSRRRRHSFKSICEASFGKRITGRTFSSDSITSE